VVGSGVHAAETCRSPPPVAIPGAREEPSGGGRGGEHRRRVGGRAVREVQLPLGVASAVGSLPHTSVEAAVELALAAQPRLPAAPSLPRRSPVEGMIPQAAWGIAGVEVLPDGSLLVDEAAVDPDAPVGPGLDDPPFA